ncbi:MAG: hypothetical protein H6739_10130 [Alphaproteobacteria bacterium]|nr:hypothetical protein [Alphaproteobacteria bacterium]
MSYGLHVYSADPAAVIGAVGSDDVKLRRMIGGRFKRDIQQSDEWFASEIQAGAPPLYEALRALIHGGALDDRYGFQYGYAFELICRHYGRFQPNDGVSACRYSWIEAVDGALTDGGLKAADFMDLAFGGAPVRFPAPDDFPGTGTWSAEQVKAAQGELAGVTVASEFEEALGNVRAWCAAAAPQGHALFGFYY